MLKNVARPVTDPQAASVKIGEAAFPVPFVHTLEYSSPARGTWNIVHTGMLVPEAHQIYICAAGCLRGVILTAAEMGLMGRFSTLELREQDLVGTDSEAQIIEGVTDILTRLAYTPRAVLVFSVCTHHFLGCNLNFVYAELERRFPQIDFARCYMDPIRQTHAPTPDETERQAIYGLEDFSGKEEKVLQIVGSNLATERTADFIALAEKMGWQVRELARTQSYEEFRSLGRAARNVFISPLGRRAAQDMARLYGRECMYLPAVWREEDVAALLEEFAAFLAADEGAAPAVQSGRGSAEGSPLAQNERADESGEPKARPLQELSELLNGAPVALDYSLVSRPLNLARCLAEHGFNLTRLYADGFLPEEERDFRWLQEKCPQLEIFPTKHAVMRLVPRETEEKILALGQKAAYFTQTPYFVNMVDNGGLWGRDGLLRLAELMREAWLTPKDTRREVSRKGWGGPCCL